MLSCILTNGASSRQIPRVVRIDKCLQQYLSLHSKSITKEDHMAQTRKKIWSMKNAYTATPATVFKDNNAFTSTPTP